MHKSLHSLELAIAEAIEKNGESSYIVSQLEEEYKIAKEAHEIAEIELLEAELAELEALELELAALEAEEAENLKKEIEEKRKSLDAKKKKIEDQPVRKEYSTDEKSISFGDFTQRSKKNYKKAFAFVMGFLGVAAAVGAYFLIMSMIPPALPQAIGFELRNEISTGSPLNARPNSPANHFYAQSDFYLVPTLRNSNGSIFTGDNREVEISIVGAGSQQIIQTTHTIATSGTPVRIEINRNQIDGATATIMIRARHNLEVSQLINVFVDQPTTELEFINHNLDIQYESTIKGTGIWTPFANSFLIGEYAKLNTTATPQRTVDKFVMYDIIEQQAYGHNPNNEDVVIITDSGYIIANFPGTARVRAGVNRWSYFNDPNSDIIWTDDYINITVSIPPIEEQHTLLDTAIRRQVANFGSSEIAIPLSSFITTLRGPFAIRPYGSFVTLPTLTDLLISRLVGEDWWNAALNNPNLLSNAAPEFVRIEYRRNDEYSDFENFIIITPPQDVSDWANLSIAPSIDIVFNTTNLITNAGRHIFVELQPNTLVYAHTLKNSETQRILNIGNDRFFETIDLRDMVEVRAIHAGQPVSFDSSNVYFRVYDQRGGNIVNGMTAISQFIAPREGTFFLRPFVRAPFNIYQIQTLGSPLFPIVLAGNIIHPASLGDYIEITVTRITPQIESIHDQIFTRFLNLLDTNFNQVGSVSNLGSIDVSSLLSGFDVLDLFTDFDVFNINWANGMILTETLLETYFDDFTLDIMTDSSSFIVENQYLIANAPTNALITLSFYSLSELFEFEVYDTVSIIETVEFSENILPFMPWNDTMRLDNDFAIRGTDWEDFYFVRFVVEAGATGTLANRFQGIDEYGELLFSGTEPLIGTLTISIQIVRHFAGFTPTQNPANTMAITFSFS